ncbi:response regulator transcription factor [Propionivibrio dicarboxylicus]|uniref:Two component transcriptional regulator, LuxR family n=1 Tax=Propionivibrio dicarboxylicus TaxID=83767 RepID=A0A1G8AE71_9RHOO|nr:response regulator [Propionivibrio dicarboxylicus]SDH19191.1 two component transcriptional regulator, LuxR family [Propionivibrio dicarboxylicus]
MKRTMLRESSPQCDPAPAVGPSAPASDTVAPGDAAVAWVVDDDKIIRRQLEGLLVREGLTVRAFASSADFLAEVDDRQPGCILLDVELPDRSGIELQADLNARSIGLPVIFLTGHGTIPMAVDALRSGAVTFLEKPVAAGPLLQAVRQALAVDAKSRKSRAREQNRLQKLQKLTGRERQVLDLVVQGLSNKEIGRVLGISFRTVEIHRSRIMTKLEIESVIDLVELARPPTTEGVGGR